MLIQWRKKYSKRDRIQAHVLKSKDREMLVTTEQVIMYDKIFERFRKDRGMQLKRSNAVTVKK